MSTKKEPAEPHRPLEVVNGSRTQPVSCGCRRVGGRMTAAGRWWSRVSSAPMRALARRLSRRLPHDSYDGIELVLSGPAFAQQAQAFLDGTREALRFASARAPCSYARFREDIKTIFLVEEDHPSLPYHRFQLAVLVPRSVALADVSVYSTWLLYASGLSRSRDEARDRTSELLDTLDANQREDAIGRLPHSSQ